MVEPLVVTDSGSGHCEDHEVSRDICEVEYCRPGHRAAGTQVALSEMHPDADGHGHVVLNGKVLRVSHKNACSSARSIFRPMLSSQRNRPYNSLEAERRVKWACSNERTKERYVTSG